MRMTVANNQSKDVFFVFITVYIGQAVLDYSKLSMYKLFYEVLPQFPLIHNISLLGGDTDSFFLSLIVDRETSQYDVFMSMKDYVDFSNYPPNHPLHSNTNKSKLGCFKDECAGKEIDEIILLRPKRVKGISQSVIRNMRHESYQDVYKNSKENYVHMTIIRSHAHSLHTVSFRKRVLSCFDDKCVWLNHNFSLPYGHKDSPAPSPKRRRISLPARGDVENDS